MTANSTHLVAEIPIRDGEVVRVTRDLSHGRWRVVMREWFRDDSNEWRPGRSGITIKREIAAPLVSAILDAATRGGAP